ncbi:hypothetical protein FIV00_03325 [Labrenzia sp. THAF82]|nr:hypothetical protein FIV00_03325 [Labrenzia sp. THAF82]
MFRVIAAAQRTFAAGRHPRPIGGRDDNPLALGVLHRNYQMVGSAEKRRPLTKNGR